MNDESAKMDSFDMTVNFVIQKLKSKHTSLKKYTNWDKVYSSLVLRGRVEKNQIFFTQEVARQCEIEKDIVSLEVVNYDAKVQFNNLGERISKKKLYEILESVKSGLISEGVLTN